jgi:hypothetical protein
MRSRKVRRVVRRVAPLAVAAAALASLMVSSPAAAAPAPPPLAPVLQQVLRGDLVMAGNSNLLSAGGWRADGQEVADVDDDTSVACVGRTYVPAVCADNSSTATLDVPAGARIVAARLYVDTTLSSAVRPIRVRLDGPGDGFQYDELNSAADSAAPKLSESAGSSVPSATPLRQAVWDVTDYVRLGGPGAYTVADIVFERAGAFLPYASWAIVAAYELDPAADVATMSPEQQARFAPRSISWFDGFAVTSNATTEVPVGGFEVPVGQPVFGKTFHLVAHAQHRGADNLLFGGQPLGNNVSPGDPPPPLGVTVGDEPACNTTTRILDDSICQLGTAVVTKTPGATAYLAAGDGRTSSSGSGVDMDVTRIPARYFVPGTTTATLALRTFGYTPVATGMLAVSIDLPAGSGPTP